ncbi:MAG: hypothetical protein EXR06_00050 [Rickettsiales bacterium]|nr:hypothetical protein [Rickettsiales bacterium]
MNKKFIKSMVAAIAGLGLLSSCSMMSGKDSHKCGGKNSCKGKGKAIEDSNKCSSSKKEEAKKAESNNCGAKNGCSAAKADVAKTSKSKKSTTKKN